MVERTSGRYGYGWCPGKVGSFRGALASTPIRLACGISSRASVGCRGRSPLRSVQTLPTGGRGGLGGAWSRHSPGTGGHLVPTRHDAAEASSAPDSRRIHRATSRSFRQRCNRMSVAIPRGTRDCKSCVREPCSAVGRDGRHTHRNPRRRAARVGGETRRVARVRVSMSLRSPLSSRRERSGRPDTAGVQRWFGRPSMALSCHELYTKARRVLDVSHAV